MTLPNIPSFPAWPRKGSRICRNRGVFRSGQGYANYSMSNVAIGLRPRSQTRLHRSPPVDLTFSTDASFCRSPDSGDLGDPTVVDDGAYGTPTAVRGDALGLDARIHSGATTVTWSGLMPAAQRCADQTITIMIPKSDDCCPRDVVINTDPGQPTARSIRHGNHFRQLRLGDGSPPAGGVPNWYTGCLDRNRRIGTRLRSSSSDCHRPGAAASHHST